MCVSAVMLPTPFECCWVAALCCPARQSGTSQSATPVKSCCLPCRSSQLNSALTLDYRAARAVLSELQQDAARFPGDVKPQQHSAGRKHSALSFNQPKRAGKLQREMCVNNTPPWAAITNTIQCNCFIEAAIWFLLVQSTPSCSAQSMGASCTSLAGSLPKNCRGLAG